MPKLTKDQRAAIGRDGRTAAAIAAEYEVSERTIYTIRAAAKKIPKHTDLSRETCITEVQPEAPRWSARFEVYLRYRRAGSSIKDAAGQAGLAYQSVKDKRQDPEFRADDDMAEAVYLGSITGYLSTAAELPENWRAAITILERREKDVWKPPVNESETRVYKPNELDVRDDDGDVLINGVRFVFDDDGKGHPMPPAAGDDGNQA